ncbi:MAG: TVP38/TMEM64 family protein [Bacillota bacterium]
MLKKFVIFTSIIVIIFAGTIVIEHTHPGKFPIMELFNNSREIADWMTSFGAWAVLISIVVMIIQAIATPVPLFLVAGANGFIFGIVWGILITLTGAMIGSTAAFFMARFLAREYFTKRFSKYIPQVEEMSRKNGARFVFLARLVPVIPSSIISYAAGLSKVSFRWFFVASVFGKLPEIIIYTALGHSLERAEGLFTKITVVIILASLICFSFQSKRLSSLYGKLTKR